MLRGLGGVAVHDIEADDWQATCGDEAFPLLHAVWNTYTQVLCQ